MQNVCFIINPFSAKKKYQPILNAILAENPNANYYISESLEGTFNYIKEHWDSTEIFVAIGGDGTISSVASQLINSNKILAIFPAGSGNGFSNENGFDKSVKNLLGKIKKGDFHKIDTFTVNGEFSINVSGVGFDGKVVKEFEKTSRGLSNYVKVSIKTFFSYKPITIEFHEEILQKYNGKYLMMNIANTRQFGNNAYIAPHASKTDGKVELALVKKFPLGYGLGFAYKMFAKKLKADNYLNYVSTSSVKLTVDSEDWHIDGEYRKISSPVSVQVLPKSLCILK